MCHSSFGLLPLAEASDPALCGAKAARLARVIQVGLAVPPGFVLTIPAMRQWSSDPQALMAPLLTAVEQLGAVQGRQFGQPTDPLLLAVRPSPVREPARLMPGAYNIGLTRAGIPGLSALGDDRFGLDCYARLLQSFGAAVTGTDPGAFEDALYELRREAALADDAAFDAPLLARAVDRFEALIADSGGQFPQSAEMQLHAAITGIAKSWASRAARTQRQLRGFAEDEGFAVIVQAMVYGNLDANSGVGVAQSRDPQTGHRADQGAFLTDAQGDEVRLGLRPRRKLSEAARKAAGLRQLSLEELVPHAHAQMQQALMRAEAALRAPVEMEFVVESGAFWLTDVREQKLPERQVVACLVDMAEQGILTPAEVVRRVDPAAVETLLHPAIDPTARRDVFASGLAASPGAVTGALVFSPDVAAQYHGRGEAAILVRIETSPEDIAGVHAAVGVLTTRGGMTSHAAVVTRGLGKPCVVGATDARLDLEARTLIARDGRVLREGAIITLDGTAGEAMMGALPLTMAQVDGAFSRLMEWADQIRRMRVRANADTPADAEVALRFGAEGIGLCRTEHMFFQAERIIAMREMILADSESERRAALERIIPMQRQDFEALFRLMAGKPVTIRLLDPPLHEFLPHSEREIADLARATGKSEEAIRHRAADMEEFNPMLGKRGCRVGVAFPEIYEMQVRAIIEAAIAAKRATGKPVTPEIMVPLVSAARELELLKAIIDRTAQRVLAAAGAHLPYRIGAMVETPRAALRAQEIVASAQFLSFGTNDLTQMTYGLSRDDAGRFMRDYITKSVFPADPFHQLDQEGVGELIRIAVQRARQGRPDVSLGICGEHGGDPASVGYFERAGLDYVSCSPFRVPIARLAAAQAVLRS